jgi:hypothetical protein
VKSSERTNFDFQGGKKFSRRLTSGFVATLLAVLAFSLSVSLAHATNPVPLVNALLSPAQKAPGSATFTLTVTGTGFVSGATVYFNSTALTTTFVSSSKVTASVPAASVATAGAYPVTVANPTPGGGVSNAATFEVVKSGYTVAWAELNYKTDVTPQDVVAGDFNHDGFMDLAVATGNNSVSILLGNGSGTFATHTEYPVPADPVAIISGDFNGDGKLDIATVDQFQGEVTVLLGVGDGTFEAHKESPAGIKPLGLVAGDFNGDGKLDLAVAASNDNKVAILLGNGDGSFKAPVEYATGNAPEGVAVGDFNGDNKLDLVVANNGDGTVSILLGNGDGTFGGHTDYPTAVGVNSVAVGDFNGDGKLDVAACTSNKQVSILLGTGAGTLQNHVEYSIGANAIAIAVADLNSDGKLDIATANYNDNTVSTLVGNGDGTFKGQNVFLTQSGPSGIALADFNNNGKIDIAAANVNSNTVSINTDSWLVLSPTLVSFGTVTSGDPSAAKTISLANKGTTPYTMGTLAITGNSPTDFTQTNTCPKAGATLAAGATCSYSVVFDPTASEVANSFIALTSANGSVIGDELTGTGNIPITLNPRTQTFPTTLVGTKSAGKTNTFTNSSGVNIYFTNIDLEGINQSDFSLTSTCAGGGPPFNYSVPLLPGASCTSTVYFSPTVLPGENETVTFVYYGNFTLAKQGLLINGVGTQVKVSPTSITFPNTKVGSTSTGVVTIQNVATTAMPLTGSYFTNGTSNVFSIQSNTCGYVQGASHGSVPANGTCTFTLAFTPAVTGLQSVTFNIGDADITGPQQVSLKGTGD